MRIILLVSLFIPACDTVDGGIEGDATLPPAGEIVQDSLAETTPDTDDTAADPDDISDDVEDVTDADTEDVTDDAITDTDDVTADTADGDIAPPPPPDLYLTIAGVPPEMNGSRPTVTPTGSIDFRLRANRARVDLEAVAADGPFPPGDLTIACTADGADHALPPPELIAPDRWRVAVRAEHAFPDGAAVSCSAVFQGAAGDAAASYAFDAATLPPELDPFPTTDLWLVQLVRDTFTLQVTELPDGTTALLSDHTPDGDGVDDFDAPFFEVGLFPASDPDKTAIIRAHLLRNVRALTYAIYGLDEKGNPTPDGVDMRILFEGDPGAPSPADFGGERRFSMIALTGDGDPEDQLAGTFGRALIDWNNQDPEDDTVFGLGVWPAAIARAILGNPAGAFLLADIRPALGGTPYGLAEGDDLFIGQDRDPGELPSAIRQRAGRYNLLIRFGSLALAAILTHEIGHSLGLVPYGAPPKGLFAGVDADWMASYAPDAHIDTVGLNIMQTGGSVNWLEAATGNLPRFEPLSWAYLRRQLVVGPP